jgi:hypothetical protein
LDGQRQLDAGLAAGNVLPDLLAFHVCKQVVSELFYTFAAPAKEFPDLHSGPWSTDGVNMQAPESVKSVLRSMPLVTVLLLLWSILDTEM